MGTIIRFKTLESSGKGSHARLSLLHRCLTKNICQALKPENKFVLLHTIQSFSFIPALWSTVLRPSIKIVKSGDSFATRTVARLFFPKKIYSTNVSTPSISHRVNHHDAQKCVWALLERDCVL